MSATTIAVATMTETVDPPPGSRLGHAALPVSVAAMSVHVLGAHTPVFSSCRLTPLNSSKVNNDLNLGPNLVILYLRRCGMPIWRSAALRKEGDRPTIATR